MRGKLTIIVFLLFVTCTAAGSNSHGYYRIHRDSAATAREIDKNLAAIAVNVDTIITKSTELLGQISEDIEQNGIRTVKIHQRFYYPLIFFAILYLIWLKTRDK